MNSEKLSNIGLGLKIYIVTEISFLPAHIIIDSSANILFKYVICMLLFRILM